MTKIILAPGDLKPYLNSTRLFLGGGITGCRDWQSEACEYLSGFDKLVIYNPRREFAPDSAEEQISWEWQALRLADAISFWFSSETIQPITLFELGRWSSPYNGSRKPLFVGMDPSYSRRQDVELQMKFECPHLKIVYDLKELCEDFRKWYNQNVSPFP